MSDKDRTHTWSKGYDYITTEPNAAAHMDSPVCGQRMYVNRGRYGPTCYAEAMARKGHTHDRFTCPDGEERWHAEALALKKEADETVSTRVRALIEEDLAELIRSNL